MASALTAGERPPQPVEIGDCGDMTLRKVDTAARRGNMNSLQRLKRLTGQSEKRRSQVACARDERRGSSEHRSGIREADRTRRTRYVTRMVYR